jgi:mRNA-degrading endonuclease RelE of RelBE toxin-antitoxin system
MGFDMYEIEVTPEAIGDSRMLKKRERQIVIREVEEQLRYEPTQETRNRKRLHPNQLAEWELRLERYRVFYDVDNAIGIVKVVAVGLKIGNRLYIQNEEYQL